MFTDIKPWIKFDNHRSPTYTGKVPLFGAIGVDFKIVGNTNNTDPKIFVS